MGTKAAEAKMEEGRIVTLIGANLAKVGEEFLFLGISKKCEECRLKNACANLEVGRLYTIERVRNEMKHECLMHEGGACVVEVRESNIRAVIEASYAFKNSKVAFDPLTCNELECALFDVCHPSGLKRGDRCTILEVIGEAPINCRQGRVIKLVTLRREPT
jgi:uncharacterized protein (UPF0179 family)